MARKATVYDIFAICPPGLEGILNEELMGLGIRGKVLYGGVEFKGDLLTLYSVNLWLRTASRILVRIGKVKLDSLKDAPRIFARYPWELYLHGSRKIRVRASCHKSRIYHSGALAERLALGISRRLKYSISIVGDGQDESAPLVFVRLLRDSCTISVDSSGAHLHKRGYRRFAVVAPIRETLAAAMSMVAGHDGSSVLLDPFCGSGTILIEAAMLASRIPPGLQRKFAFMQWGNFDRMLWHKILQQSEQFRKGAGSPIIGMDRDDSALLAAQGNVQQAGLADVISLRKADALLVSPPDPSTGLIVTNPPYGRRNKENDSLMDFYARLGKHWKDRFRGWSVCMVLPKKHPGLRRSLGIPMKRVASFSNGGIEVELLTGTI